MPIEPKSSEMMPDEPALERPEDSVARVQVRADVAADAALILAALSRIEGAVRDERGIVDRLRGLLEDMAQAIARTKAALALASGTLDIGTLLDELDHRVDTMIEVADGRSGAAAAAPEQTVAEAGEVPTVSGVVFQLGADAVSADFDTQEPPHLDAPEEDAVTRLKEMVEALNAAAAEPVAEPQATAPDEAIETHETAAANEAAPPDELAPAEQIIAATGANEERASAPAAIPGDGVIDESELLARFERMGAMPILPPEEGTAVIFSTATTAEGPAAEFSLGRTTPEERKLDLPVLPEVTDPQWAALHAEVVVPSPVAEPATEPEVSETAQVVQDIPPQTIQEAAQQETPPEAVLERAAAVAAESVLPPEATMAPELPTVEVPDAEFDPDDFLFGPEAEPDPAAFLLEPAPPLAKGGALAPPDFVSAPVVPAALPMEQDEPPVSPAEEPEAAETLQPTPPAPAPPPHDPLHAIKAMSANERLAMFS